VNEPDRDRVQEVEFLAASPLGHYQPCRLEQPEVFHHTKTGHLEALFNLARRLAVLSEELVEQTPACRIGQGLEHLVHNYKIGD
jgi:hypothetical protein